MDLSFLAGTDLVTIGLAVLAVLGIGGVLLAAYMLPFSMIYGVKMVTGYASSLLWPVWIMVRQKGWYTVAAFLLAFSNFFIHIYSLVSTQKLKLWDYALAALHNTFASSLSEIVQSGRVLIQGPNLIQFATSIGLILMAVSKIYFWYIGWNFAKKRVPHFTFWALATFALLVLVWGGDGSQPLFDAFEFMQTAANQTAAQVPK